MSNTKLENIRQLIAQGEGQQLELKHRVPSIKLLASILSAFANTNGGKIIIGVADDGSIVGVDNVEHSKEKIQLALKEVSPSLEVETETARINGKSLLIITIPKGSKPPYLAAGRAVQRVGVSTRPLDSQTLSARILERSTTKDTLKKDVKRLSEMIEILGDELAEVQSWKAKIPEMIIGGIIGALISFLISMGFGF